MTEQFIGQIQTVAFNFAPRSWTLAEGQLLAISSNEALFSLFGTTYGGDGRTTFGIPDFRGRSPVGVGSGAGLNPTSWGQKGGQNEILLTKGNLPQHKHAINASSTSGANQTTFPLNNFPGVADNDVYSESGGTSMALNAMTSYGGSQPLSIQNPFLGLYITVALFGIYPSRS